MKTFTLTAIVASLMAACATGSNAQSTRQSDAVSTPPLQPLGQMLAQSVTDGSSLTEINGQLNQAQRWRAEQISIAEEADLVFKILAAEIAGRRGRVDIAASNYFDAANASNDPRVAERAVKLALYSRDWDRADQAVGLWVDLVPDSVDAWQHKAQISLQQKKVANTTAALEKVINLSGDTPAEVIPGVVNSILSQSDAQTGGKVLAELGKKFPDSADTQYGIGRIAMSNGQRDKALQAFERALEIDPDNVEAVLASARLHLEAGKGVEAYEPVEDYIKREPQNVQAQLGYARLLVESGKYEMATERFNEIAALFPENADALYSIGLLALEIKRVKQAEEYLLNVIALQQHEDSSYYYLGRISDSRKDYREAIERYQQVQDGDNFFDAQIRSAELYGLVGEVDKGRELISNLKSYSDSSTIQVELINSESRLLNSNNQYEEALGVLTKGLTQHEDEPSLLYARALVAERLDQREVFEKDLEKVIAAQPDNSYALNALGYFLADRNERLDEAEKYLSRAFELMPNDPAIIDSLGWLYYRQNKYDKAIELLRRAHTVLPDAEIAAHLGEVLWVSGEQDEATKVWEEALREAPDDDLLKGVMKKYKR